MYGTYKRVTNSLAGVMPWQLQQRHHFSCIVALGPGIFEYVAMPLQLNYVTQDAELIELEKKSAKKNMLYSEQEAETSPLHCSLSESKLSF